MKRKFYKSFMGGMFVAIGMLLFMATGNSFVFGLGILGIYFSESLLLTTYIPHLGASNKSIFNKDVLCVILGNLIGAFFIGCLGYLILPEFILSNTVSAKMSKDFFQLIGSSIFTGMMIGVGKILTYKTNNRFYQAIALYVTVTLFVILRTEHVVANATIAFMYFKIISLIVVPLIGNIVGGYLIGKLYYLTK